MRLLTLREFETSEPTALSVEERDRLRAVVSDLRIEPAAGSADAYLITPGSTVGSAALDTLAVEIRPKITIPRLLFLLSYSIGLAKWADAPFEVATEESLIEALVPVLVWHLKRALARGVLQGYRVEDTAMFGVRGRVRLEDQVRTRYGMALPLEVRYDEFTEDVLENRLLKAAIRTLGRLRLRSSENRQSLRRFDHLLELVSSVEYPAGNVPKVAYSHLTEHYRGAVEWARLILRFASFEPRHGQRGATAVLFDMNDVFEEFVRTALREELGATAAEFPSGGSAPPLFLDEGGRISLEPDLSWWFAKRCIFVGDVKYKRVNARGVKHPDLYQLLAYTTAADLAAGLLVYAAGEGDPADHDVLFARKTLHVRSLVLNGPIEELRREIGGIASFVRQLAGKRTEAVAS